MNSTAMPQYSAEYLAESQAYKIINPAITFIVLDTVAVILRFVSRKLQKTPWIWADVYVPIGWFFDISAIVAALVTTRYGAGRHLPAVPPEDFPPFFKSNYYAQPVLYFIGVNIPKLAILDIYLHVFIDRWSRSAVYVTQFIIVAQIIVNVPVTMTQCQPLQYLWDQSIPGGHCHNIAAHFFWSALPNIVTDLVMLILPIPVIRRLHTSRSTKFGLLLTFLLGNLGLAFSIVRFVGFHYVYDDTTWTTVQGSLWTIVEPGVYLICACMITYRPLFSWIAHDSLLSSYIGRSRLWASSHTARSSSGGRKTGKTGVDTLRNNTFLHPTRKRSHPEDELASISRPEIFIQSGRKNSKGSGSASSIAATNPDQIMVHYDIESTSIREV